MSIGDSLLDYFSLDEIKSKINSYKDKGFIYNSKDFYSLTFFNIPRFETYDSIQMHFRNKDKTFIIQSINGSQDYKDNIKDCYPKLNSIKKEFDTIFKNTRRVGNGIKRNHKYDKSEKSTTLDYYYYFNNNNNYEFISVVCTDWSNEIKLTDDLQVQMSGYEFGDFLFNRAY